MSLVVDLPITDTVPARMAPSTGPVAENTTWKNFATTFATGVGIAAAVQALKFAAGLTKTVNHLIRDGVYLNERYGAPLITREVDRALLDATAFAVQEANNLVSILTSPDRTQEIKSRILSYSKNSPPCDELQLISSFRSMPRPTFKVNTTTHTHGQSAARRSETSLFAESLAELCGMEAYYISMSTADVRHGRQGSRAWYWTKDIGVAPRSIAVRDHHLLVMVDVDYHLDMPTFMTTYPRNPILLYTFSPSQVAKVEKEYTYTFMKDGKVSFKVVGGGRYTHQVWDYNYDSLVVEARPFGFPILSVTYKVERFSTDDDHEAVLLVPIGYWKHLAAMALHGWVPGNPLQRLDVVTGDFTHLSSFGPNGHITSVGIPGNVACAVMTTVDFEAALSNTRTSKHPVTRPDAATAVTNGRPGATILLEYLRSVKRPTPPIVMPVQDGLRTYQFNPSQYDPGVKSLMQCFMSPIINGAFCPAKCLTSDQAAVTGRIEKVRPMTMTLKPTLSAHMKDFVNLFVGHMRGHCAPVHWDDVLERQCRPTQLRLLHSSMLRDPDEDKLVSTTFTKAETYPKIADPRIISTISTPTKREYSRYMYGLEILFKAAPWYAFGKCPVEISQRVADSLDNKSMAVNTDFSRFDGHGSNLMRELERRLLAAAFSREDVAIVQKLHEKQYGLKAVTYFGAWYDTGYARLSGSPETSLFNSFVNAFIAYVALRGTKRSGSFLEPTEAYRSLGIYGGDDGLTADVDTEAYQKAAAELGQVLDINPVSKGQLGIKFLARVYGPGIWYGDTNSCCDIPRQLGKFHTCVPMPATITAKDKLVDKIRAISLTDCNTPIFRELIYGVSRTVNVGEVPNPAIAQYSRFWLDQVDPDLQYRNELADWMDDYVSQALPEFNYQLFTASVTSASTIDAFLSLPLCMEMETPKPPAPVVIDGDIHPADWRRESETEFKTQPVDVSREPVPVEDLMDRKHSRPSKKQEKPLTPQEHFEKVKQKKIAEGTWKERPPAKSGGKGPAKPRNSSDKAGPKPSPRAKPGASWKAVSGPG